MIPEGRKIRDDYDPYPNARRDALGQVLMEDLGEVDLYQLLANLRLTPDERLIRMEQLNAWAREVAEAGAKARHERRQADAGTGAQRP